MKPEKSTPYKPLRHEYRLEYCVNGCDEAPVSHERKLYPGHWIVRCTECLYMRRIETSLGLTDDYEHMELSHAPIKVKKNPNKPHGGAAAMVEQLLATMRETGFMSRPGDTMDIKWLRGMLGLQYGLGMPPYAIIKRMLARGYIEATGERTVYRWLEF